MDKQLKNATSLGSVSRSSFDLLTRGVDLCTITKFHGSDLLQAYGSGPLQDYVIHFANGLDPNFGSEGLLQWPQYDLSSKQLVTFLDGNNVTITEDTFRQDAVELVQQLSSKSPE